VWYTPFTRTWVRTADPHIRWCDSSHKVAVVESWAACERGCAFRLGIVARNVGFAMAHEKERRSAVRNQTARRAVFVTVDGSTLLQEGIVLDMSRDGLQLVTRQPAAVGKIIELEIEPRDGAKGSSPIVTRGRISRVRDLGNGDYSMGVKLRFRQTSAYSVRSSSPPRRALGESRSAVGQSWLRQNSRHWIAGALAAAMVLMTIFLWPKSMSGSELGVKHSGGNTLSGAKSGLKEPSREDEQDRGAKRIGRGEGGSSGMMAVPRKNDTPQRVSRADDGADARLSATAMQSVRETDGDVAETAAATNESGTLRAALSMLKQARAEEKSAPVASKAGASRDHIAELVRAVAPLIEADAAAAAREDAPYLAEGIHLHVQKESYLLTVYRNGKPFTQYPISLGANNATPSGLFTIHNKIQNPDWNNDGELVPHGDPRNPLGASWMGFSRDGEPTSFGIHPTDKPEDIGKSTGLGCVRLKPDHAAALFRLCPIGATVTVE